MVKKILVLGGGSAGLLAAVALKKRIPQLDVLVVRSRDIGIIGVGEGSTPPLNNFLHNTLGIGYEKFFQVAQPTWKLGLRFLWGPRPYFNYTFGPSLDGIPPGLGRAAGYYSQEEMEHSDLYSAMMTHNTVFQRSARNMPLLHPALAYHFENEKFVEFLEGFAKSLQVRFLDDTVAKVNQDDAGISKLELQSGACLKADLFVDCSGFGSLLLSKTLKTRFESYDQSLFCDRAAVGGWDRTSEVIKPYTTCETMDSGWCWQIEHAGRINRGYVYSSGFISDEQAEMEFRQKNPKVQKCRIVRFISGRYERSWVKNVVAIGNASGFVEPLEATALAMIAMQSQLLGDTIADCDGEIRASAVKQYNGMNARSWDSIRDFLALHYKFNTRIDTPFWRHCREDTALRGAEEKVEMYRELGPSALWKPMLFDSMDQFRNGGYPALLLGQNVPFRRTYFPSEAELTHWEALRTKYEMDARAAMGVAEALRIVHAPEFRWAKP